MYIHINSLSCHNCYFEIKKPFTLKLLSYINNDCANAVHIGEDFRCEHCFTNMLMKVDDSYGLDSYSIIQEVSLKLSFMLWLFCI